MPDSVYYKHSNGRYGKFIQCDKSDPDCWLEFRRNYPFTATIKYTGFGRGRSAAHTYFEYVDTGWKYTMFLTDLGELIKKVGVDKDGVTAQWTFVKRGRNYGIKLYKVKGE